MKYADINKRYTESVAEYISKVYAINTATMSGIVCAEKGVRYEIG